MPVRSEFLHTAHLVLSPFSPDDAERAMDMLTDQAIGRTYMLPEFPCREASRPLFERLFCLSQHRDRFIYSI